MINITYSDNTIDIDKLYELLVEILLEEEQHEQDVCTDKSE